MIFFKLFDVGRNINLNAVAETLPASPDIRIVNSKDSPESLSVPVPLRMILDNYYFPLQVLLLVHLCSQIPPPSRLKYCYSVD